MDHARLITMVSFEHLDSSDLADSREGLQVAKLASLPIAVHDRAEEVAAQLTRLEFEGEYLASRGSDECHRPPFYRNIRGRDPSQDCARCEQ